MRDAIAIIDLGGQYCHLIRRRLRELGFRSDILQPEEAGPTRINEYAGLILSGGPRSVYEPDAPRVNKKALETGRPVLGICYGHQLLALTMGGKVAPGSSEYGSSTLELVNDSRLFAGAVHKNLQVWMSHGDSVTTLPEGFHPVGTTDACLTAAFADEDRALYGIQFHPEVDHTEYGSELLENFARICGLEPHDLAASRVDDIIDEIQAQVGDGSVFFLVSGGVDSMVAFTLCAKALGRERVLGLYVDTGFMRINEAEELRDNLRALKLLDRVQVCDAADEFFRELARVTDPEKKRKKIGALFVKIQAEAMQRNHIDPERWFLGQGTIFPDTIESGGKSGKAALIKTHHNRCAEIQALLERGRVVEPLADLYKDEVREVGRQLGLSSSLLGRWPFPGPGLAIRVLCSDASRSDRPVMIPDEAARPYCAFSLPIKSVGVQGDARTYKRMLALEGPFDNSALHMSTSNLCNANTEYNRVVYVVRTRGGQSIQNARVRGARLTHERVSVLQHADAIVRDMIVTAGLHRDIWQFPVILLPVQLDGREVIVLRPVDSENGMTANFSRLSERVLFGIADRILEECRVGGVVLDVTDKPPATIEWE